MITPRSARAVTISGFTLLAVALVAATIHVTMPDYAGVAPDGSMPAIWNQTIAGNATKEITRRGMRLFIAR